MLSTKIRATLSALLFDLAAKVAPMPPKKKGGRPKGTKKKPTEPTAPPLGIPEGGANDEAH